MLSREKLSQYVQEIANSAVRLIKARRREEAAIGLAAILLWLGYSFSKWLPPELKSWIDSWRGLQIIPGIFYVAGVAFLLYGLYRIWLLVHTPELPSPRDRPSAIKGPIAFTPAEGELFRRLGREEELRKLLGFIEDDQVRLVVLMGASGVGKTSLLRAGLTDILKNKSIDCHYWEAVPTEPGHRLLRAIQESWQHGTASTDGAQQADAALPTKLEDLVNPAPALGARRHVIVLDQFEQLYGSSASNPILRLLRKVAREARPPHRVTWVVAFRREFRAEWEDFTLPEKERGIYPSEVSLPAFTAEQARDVISQLIADAQLAIQQKVVDSLVAAATVDGEVSPVDIGIGLLVLAELHDRRGGYTVTLEDYQFAGGAEGLLTQYLSRCLDSFSDLDRQTIINAMLALRHPGTHQRVAEGRSCADLAKEINVDVKRLRIQLGRLTQRNVRLLEMVPRANESVERYRLPHERLIPALHRVAGQSLAEVDQTRLKFENAFTAWKNSGERRRYLLKGAELRSVERYESQIPWGRNASDKRAFLRRSQRQRTLTRLRITGEVSILLVLGWVAIVQYQRNDARTFLADNHYPSELYDWQNQLTTLKLHDPIKVQPFRWLHSNSLEEFTLTVDKDTDALDNLVASLGDCPKLRKLNLNLNSSHVSDLKPILKLTQLTELQLSENWKAKDLNPLCELPALAHLSLDVEGLDDVSPLARLPALIDLTLRVRFQAPNEPDLSPLRNLPSRTRLHVIIEQLGWPDITTNLQAVSALSMVTKLDVHVSGFMEIENLDLRSLTQLRRLEDLTFEVEDSCASFSQQLSTPKLMPLKQLPSTVKLNLILNGPCKDLTPLADLPNLTRLEVKRSNGGPYYIQDVPDMTPLERLPSLTDLDLHVNGGDLTTLTKLPNLTHLTLRIAYRWADFEYLASGPRQRGGIIEAPAVEVIDIGPLRKLSALTDLELIYVDGGVINATPLIQLPARMYFSVKIGGDGYINDVTSLGKVLALRKVDLPINSSVLMPLSKVPSLTHVTLRIGDGPVDLTPLQAIPTLAELELEFIGNQALDLAPLAKVGCRSLTLRGHTSQRMSLRVIPRSLTHLEFLRSVD